MSCTWPLASPPRYALRQSQWPASTAAMKVKDVAKQRLHPETPEASSEVQGVDHAQNTLYQQLNMDKTCCFLQPDQTRSVRTGL